MVIKQNQPIYIYDICLQERWESFDFKKTAVSFEHFKCEHVERNNNNNRPTAPLNAGGKFKFKKVISSPG